MEEKKEIKEKKRYERNKWFFNNKKGGETYIGKEWDSDDKSSSDDEGNIVEYVCDLQVRTCVEQHYGVCF